jgi:phosphate transport system substrate-binding protein
VAIGTYPSPPARNLYLVTKGKPTKKIIVDFIQWILTDGQTYVNKQGYVALPEKVLTDTYNKLK